MVNLTEKHDGAMTYSEVVEAWEKDRKRIAELEADLERLDWCNDNAIDAADRIAELEALMKQLRTITDRQAEDEGLWFEAVTAPEAYLQQELRKLHSAVEALLPENQHE